MNSCPVGVGTVGDHSLHTVAPSGSLFNEEPAQSSLERPSIMSNISPVSPLGDHGHIPVAFADRCLVNQQHPTGLFATMISDQPGPVTDQTHHQMPPYPVAAGTPPQ